MNWIVYKTTNLINGKIYVGVHRTNPDIFDGYIGCGISKKDNKKNLTKGFAAAVHKYGYSNFKRETLFVYPDTEEGKCLAFKKEEEIVNIDFIKRIDTYNLVVGGKYSTYPHQRIICQYTLQGQYIRDWDSILEAQDKLQLTSLINCLKHKTAYCGDFQWRYKEEFEESLQPVQKREKSIYQFDLLGNLLKVWKSASEASTVLNLSRSAILQCAAKTLTQAFGYYWSFNNKFEYTQKSHCIAVAKYDDAGNFLKSYTSLKEACEDNNIKSHFNITNVIRGYNKHCGGFRWRYFYGNTANIKPLKDNDIV